MAISIKKDLEAIQLLRKAYREQEIQVRNYQDDYLSPAGLAAERAKRMEALRADGKAALARIQSSVEVDRNWLKSKAEDAMPRPTGSTADAWARVQMLLDAGRDLNTIIRQTSDVLTLQAIREWGPTYLEAKRTVSFGDGLAGNPPVDPTPLLNSVGKRFAQLSGKESELSEYFNSQGSFAKYDVLAYETNEMLEGRGAGEMDVQITAAQAEQAASADLSVTDAA